MTKQNIRGKGIAEAIALTLADLAAFTEDGGEETTDSKAAFGMYVLSEFIPPEDYPDIVAASTVHSLLTGEQLAAAMKYQGAQLKARGAPGLAPTAGVSFALTKNGGPCVRKCGGARNPTNLGNAMQLLALLSAATARAAVDWLKSGLGENPQVKREQIGENEYWTVGEFKTTAGETHSLKLSSGKDGQKALAAFKAQLAQLEKETEAAEAAAAK